MKLAHHYINYLLDSGDTDIEEYARLRLELQARERVCRKRLRTRGRGAYRCPEKPRLPDKRTRAYIIVLALAESGARLKQLWRIARSDMREELYDAGGVRLAIIDVHQQHGYKRVNIVAMEAGLWLRARRILSRLDYRNIVDYYSKNGLTVPSCCRKMHWNTCLALGSRDLCEFREEGGNQLV